MFTTTDESRSHLRLRQIAETKIQSGSVQGTNGWTIGTAALALLHSLASNPATASDALKLLHELQVHQVELDMQHEHMEETRRELEQSVIRYTELYDFAPVAYFTVDSAGLVIEGNFTAARMLGVDRDDLGGRRVDSIVAPDSRAALLSVLEEAYSSGLRHSCRAKASGSPAGSEWLEVAASLSPRVQSCLIVVMELTDPHQGELQA